MGKICDQPGNDRNIKQPPKQDNTMSNRSVYRRHDGKWVNKRDDASKPSSVHDTQADAINQARDHLGNQGGDELSIHGVDGKIRNKDTVPPGNDPFPPRG